MNRAIFLVLILLFWAKGFLYSQNDNVIANADSIKTDSLHITSEDKFALFLNQGTDAIVNSMFGKSKSLSNADSIINVFDNQPSFGIYQDNYFIAGTELFKSKDEWNSDAKFQVSFRHRLSNSTLPFKTYFYLGYTQRAYWDIFRESFPFRDLNFNPSIGLGRALVYNNRLLGSISMQLEHESNGKDGDDSRSWNKITFGSVLVFDDNWSVRTKVWIPIVDGKGNKDIVAYSGWSMVGMDYISENRKYMASCIITNRSRGIFNANVTLNFSVRLFNDDNQFLFLEYYNGYGESMLDYKEHRNRIRLGFVIKPSFINLF